MPAWSWWLAGGMFVVVCLLRDFVMTSGGSIGDSVYWGRDFINVWTGGHLVRDGRLDLLYDLHGYAAYQRSLFGPVDPHNYSYPPLSFPLVALLSLLPYPVALGVWTVGTAALFVWAARPWWPDKAGPVWLAALTPAAIVNIWAGHYGFLIGALFLLGWQRLDDRPRQAGIFFGLMLLKPHLAVLVPLALLIRRDWQAIGSAAATVAAIVAGTTLWFGWRPWHDFLFRTSAVQAGLIDARDTLFGLMSCSAATAILRLTASWPLAVLGQLLFAAAAVAMVSIAASRRVPTRELALIVATATFLLLPYSFNYDLTVVMIGALALLGRTDLSTLDRRLALYGFLSPQLGMVTAAVAVPLTPLMLLGLGIAQLRAAVGSPLWAFKRHTALRH
ncbi:MAG TPA: glycosyltransferase family 87 protein [Sphingomicrobium sp.]